MNFKVDFPLAQLSPDGCLFTFISILVYVIRYLRLCSAIDGIIIDHAANEKSEIKFLAANIELANS